MLLTRRDWLRISSSVALSLAAPWTRAAPAPARRIRSVVMLYMEGGPSQLDTWDPRPGAPTGGDVEALSTDVAGIRVASGLPRMATCMKHAALIRTLTGREGNHDRARYLMHTGHPPQGGADHPGLGSVLWASRGPSELPGYVAIGGPGKDAGLLGSQWAPFPVRKATEPLKGLLPPENTDPARTQRRQAWWRELDARFSGQRASPVLASLRASGDQAIRLLDSTALEAFDLAREPEAARERYGRTEFGAGCLLARRLVETGVPFVEVTQRGWDTHEDNAARTRKLCGELDPAFASLLEDLASRGLLESTLVLWWGDFGRTPRVNARGGRDHFARISNVVLAGGGVVGGQAIGEVDATGEEIRSRPVTVPDLFRTLSVALGLDPDASWTSGAGRPVSAVDGGKLVEGLFRAPA